MCPHGRRPVTASQPEILRAEGVRSLEVRWIFPCQLWAALTGWFGRFPAEMTVVEDAYLLDPHLPGLSVKIRGRRALEVKAYRGSPGLLEVAGRARGRLESWQKWSFPHGPLSHGNNDPAGWMPVTKRRRISWFSQTAGVRVPRLDEEPGCVVDSPRSMQVARPGGPWALRQPAPAICYAAKWPPPPPSCSPSGPQAV